MKIRVKIESRYVEGDCHYVTGLMVDHMTIITVGPFLGGLARVGELWLFARTRLLSKGFILTEQMEGF